MTRTIFDAKTSYEFGYGTPDHYEAVIEARMEVGLGSACEVDKITRCYVWRNGSEVGQTTFEALVSAYAAEWGYCNLLDAEAAIYRDLEDNIVVPEGWRDDDSGEARREPGGYALEGYADDKENP